MSVAGLSSSIRNSFEKREASESITGFFNEKTRQFMR